MNLMVTVALVFLLAPIEYYAKVLPRGRELYIGPSRRQDSQSLQQCQNCTKPIQVDGRSGAIQLDQVGRLIVDAKRALAKIFEKNYVNKEALRYDIDEVVGLLDEDVTFFVKRVYEDMKIANLDSCPPFKTLFHEFSINFDLALQSLTNNWEALVDTPDRDALFAVLAQSLAYDVPICLFLLQELLINSIALFLPEDCENLVPIIHNFLDPDGNVSNALANILLSTGSKSSELAANILGSIIPEKYKVSRDNLDVLKILVRLACEGVRMLYPEYKTSRNIQMLLKRSCEPELATPGFMPVVKKVLCGIAEEVGTEDVLPEIQAMCSTS